MSAAAPIEGCQKLPAGSQQVPFLVECGLPTHIWRLFDTKACNRPNHFNFAPTAPTLAGPSRCHKQIIHAARLGSPSLVFVKRRVSAQHAKGILHSCEAVKKMILAQRCRTPSVTGANFLAEAGRSSHLRLTITAQLALSRRCRVTVTPDYAEHVAQTQRQQSSIEISESSITYCDMSNAVTR